MYFIFMGYVHDLENNLERALKSDIHNTVCERVFFKKALSLINLLTTFISYK